MHQLILLRHAKAVQPPAGMADFDRPLSASGHRAAGEIGVMMRSTGLTPDMVLASPSLRTRQTLDAAGPWDAPPTIDLLPALYLAAPEQIMEALRALPETVRSVLVIGHNPSLHDVARALAGGSFGTPELRQLEIDYPTAGLTEFLVTTAWAKLGPGAAALQRFLQPAKLKPA